MSCPFCERDGERERMIEERGLCYVMLSNPALMPGHLLVIPKRHLQKPSELTTPEREEIFNTVLEYQEKTIEKYSPGCDMRQNYRPFVKESALKVDHLHYHLLPRQPHDEFHDKLNLVMLGIFKPLTEADRQKFRELYR